MTLINKLAHKLTTESVLKIVLIWLLCAVALQTVTALVRRVLEVGQ